MVCCNECKLNYSNRAGKDGQDGPAGLFHCVKPWCAGDEERRVGDWNCPESRCPQTSRLVPCLHDAYVLANLNSGEAFVEDTVLATLDTFVLSGMSELVCEMFLSASLPLRKKLWRHMTSHYRDRMRLLNPLFEKQELAPLENRRIPMISGGYTAAATGVQL